MQFILSDVMPILFITLINRDNPYTFRIKILPWIVKNLLDHSAQMRSKLLILPVTFSGINLASITDEKNIPR